MIIRYFLLVFFSCLAVQISAQHTISIEATLDTSLKTISIKQEITYQNNSKDTLNEIYLFDWANSFSSKTTPLAKRFAENYESAFHFEKDSDRGRTDIQSVYNGATTLSWRRGEDVDILKITPHSPILPSTSYSFNLEYMVKVPNDRFTRFGVSPDDDYRLRYWYISPAVYDGEWQVYSNKNTDDLYLTPSTFSVIFHYPSLYSLNSDLDLVSESILPGGKNTKTTKLMGENRMAVEVYIEKDPKFQTSQVGSLRVVSNLQNPRVNPLVKSLITDRAVHFLESRLGAYPFEKILVSETDYKNNPVYGLNQLPSFISPFPNGFELEMEEFKTLSREYINNTIVLNPRKDYWLQDALQVYLMMDYVNTHYPKMRIIGDLSKWWIIRWAHISDIEFNDQYPILYQNMARNNIHQALTVEKDSLLKFNKNIANGYYGGSGLKYLNDYLGDGVLEKSIKEFYSQYKLKPVKSEVFETILSKHTTLPVNWFFEDFVDSRSTIDFKIKRVEKLEDSLKVFIKNKRDTQLPVSVYGLNKKEIVYKTWTPPIDSLISITIPSENIRKLVLNYQGEIPEYNRRNNTENLRGILNKPLQFRLLRDVEDPNYTQVFFMPIFGYNLYDGISVGVRLNNKTLLPKAFNYSLAPEFASRSRTLVGSASLRYTQDMDRGNLYATRYGLAGSYHSYDRGLFYRRFSPYITLSFRNPDLRSNKRQHITLRTVNVHRDENVNDPQQDPNYDVFNIQYTYSNPNLINYFRGSLDYQISSKFSKLAVELEYRKLFLNNRQLNLRFFGGLFLFNNSREDENFFSFALDRAVDYMFDYNYYGRSESSGLFSQQLIIAEGGFKSNLEPAYANSWITTLNANTNIWKWIYAYGDVGLVHNHNHGVRAIFDSGIRLSLVADYFELYFPIYSSLGFEPNLPNYDQKIRFIITLSPKTLMKLFTRKWY